jgi:hypothetical protein
LWLAGEKPTELDVSGGRLHLETISLFLHGPMS